MQKTTLGQYEKALSGIFYESDPSDSGSRWPKNDLNPASFFTWYKQRLPFQMFIQKIGISRPLDISFLDAVSHTSFVHENRFLNLCGHERLEFLGDSVLSVIVSNALYDWHPEMDEGMLSKLRSDYVRKESLLELARAIELENIILLGKGEYLKWQKDGELPYLADFFESILGYLFYSFGLAEAQKFFFKSVKSYQQQMGSDFFAIRSRCHLDPKTQLQETLLAHYKELPSYKVGAIDKNEEMTISLIFRGKELASLTGKGRKHIERELAKLVLDEKTYLK